MEKRRGTNKSIPPQLPPTPKPNGKCVQLILAREREMIHKLVKTTSSTIALLHNAESPGKTGELKLKNEGDEVEKGL